MRSLRITRLRLRSFFSRTSVELELDEELRYHLDRQTEANIAAGMGDAQARRAALLDLEGIEVNKEECRDMRGLNLIENLKLDLRFAMRQLQKSPGFACTAVLILALGMSAAVSIFGLADAALIRPLPYRAPSRLVTIFGSIPLGPRFHLSSPDYADLKKLNHVFATFEVYGPFGFMLNATAGAQQADGARVSDGFFRALGVAPILGRDFRPGEDLMAAPRTACSLVAATLMKSLLFGVRSWDPLTMIAVVSTLVGVALLASYIPARRAASVQLIDALRAE